MNSPPSQRKASPMTRIALRIVAVYVLIGVLWILLTDTLLYNLIGNPDLYARISIFKGWFYVAFTALMLHLLIRQGISVLMRSEQAAHVSESKYRILMEQASDGIFVFESGGKFLDVNTKACEMLGYSHEELIHLNVSDVISPEEAAGRPVGFANLRTGEAVRIDRTMVRKDGSLFPSDMGTKRLEDGRIQAIVRDVTERKEHERHLEEHAAEQTRMLNQIMNAQEAERRRVSMDIHDGPLQSLGIALMALDRAIRRMERGEHDRAEQEIRSLRETLSSTVSELRAVLADLSLEILTYYGLIFALEEYIEHFSQVTNIDIEMENELNMRLPNNLEMLLYRLAQEALANIRKHSGASKVAISLKVEGGRVHMTISDDGKGFDVDAALSKRAAGKQLGLQSMRQRIRDAQGSLTIESAPGGNSTTLRFWCPIPRSEVNIVA
ncbi:MAG TPA: PAS domain S-box protein [Chloroflexia bacterium]|nr:PAS domain S-box protein [Chloroflexia bacterium]